MTYLLHDYIYLQFRLRLAKIAENRPSLGKNSWSELKLEHCLSIPLVLICREISFDIGQVSWHLQLSLKQRLCWIYLQLMLNFVNDDRFVWIKIVFVRRLISILFVPLNMIFYCCHLLKRISVLDQYNFRIPSCIPK